MHNRRSQIQPSLHTAGIGFDLFLLMFGQPGQFQNFIHLLLQRFAGQTVQTGKILQIVSSGHRIQ
jgi:hypothetical protein